MNNIQHILLIVNADSSQDLQLIDKARSYCAEHPAKISLLYIVPNVAPISSQLPDMIIGHPVTARFTLRRLSYYRREYRDARKNMRLLAARLNITEANRHIAVGDIHRTTLRYAVKIGADVIFGEYPSIWDLFKTSPVYRTIRKLFNYVAVLLLGYRSKFHPRKCEPAFLR